MSAREFRLNAPAKVNLWLAIHGRRDDGYHELSTLMATLDLADELVARASAQEGVQLVVSGPQASADIPTDERNLVCRAAAQVLEHAREVGHVTPAGIEFDLRKQIPSQAGLGGGSSDAVAAMRLAELVCGVDLGAGWRRERLAALGADCVFFHDVDESGLALCEGIGERVSPWPMSRTGWGLVVLVPAVTCPTGQVFGALQLPAERARQSAPWRPGFENESLADVRSLLHNDLEAAALSAVPELRAWRDWLDAEEASHLRLSGSGSSFYGLFEDAPTASRELLRLESQAAARGLHVRLARVASLGSR